MNIKASFREIDLNLLNGRTHFRVSGAKISDLSLIIDKGSNFFFLKVLAKDVQLNDYSGYPETRTEAWEKG